MPRLIGRVVVVGLSSALIVALATPAASGDALTERRDAVTQQLSQTKQDLNESSAALNSAAAAVQRTEGQLATARTALATTRRQLAAAQLRDRQLAAKLDVAQRALAAAKAAVVAGQKRLDAEKLMAGRMARDQYQQQTNLLPIALLVESESVADLQTRLQWSTTMFDTTSAQIDRYTAAQRALDAAKARQQALEQQIAADRAQAAKNLRATAALERQAAAQTTAVAGLLTQRRTEQASAAQEVAADKQQYAQLNAERDRVEQRIAARIAAAKAEAARQAAAARAAAARRAAAAKAAKLAAKRAAAARAEARRAEQAKDRAKASRLAAKARSEDRKAAKATSDSRSSSSSSGSKSSSGSRSAGNAAHGFSYPVSAPITSPYGMRFHPILHYWKLHDGTDFGASCGTAMRAPYSGKVVEKYYNSAYGNRLMIDHGTVDGRFVTTGYNHAIRYTVGVGDRVEKGEVIGYVGTTGWSTGCHLHLMVWLDGRLRNPMTWF